MATHRTTSPSCIVSSLAAALLVCGCGDDISHPAAGTGGAETGGEESGDESGEPEADDPLPDPSALGEQGIRRLSRNEVRWAILDIAGIDIAPDVDLLPDDSRTPFDNDYTTQFPSEALVVGLDALALRVAERIVDSPEILDDVLGCTPASSSDEACLREFIEHFGRLALRRPLSDFEVDEYAAFIAEAERLEDFNVAVQMVVHTLLQDLEFIYRVELGTGEPGTPDLVALGDFDIASRLSFLLWGSVPDDELLDAAQAGVLTTSAGVSEQADRMLADPKADLQLQRLHAMWLGYDAVPAPAAIADGLRQETGALLRRVVLTEGLPWISIFTFDETFVGAALADHYGLPQPASEPAWVTYPADSHRGGILSHGTFLSGETNFGDTSPVLRGRLVLERLLCREIPPPPPNVDSAEPPDFGGPDACKEEQFSMRDQEACVACHGLIDNIGYGLENYGPAGQWRDHEVDRTDCPISGEGSIEGLGNFRGADELGALLADSGQLEPCFVRHFAQLALGRPLTPDDAPTVAALTDRFESTETDFLALLRDVVASESFRYRVVPKQ